MTSLRIPAAACAAPAWALLAAVGIAQAGTTRIPAGRLQLDGHLASSSVDVSGSGVLGGDGVVGGAVMLAAGGTIAPGRRTQVGELGADALTWQGGGDIAFRLGANELASDHIALSGALTRQGTGGWTFRFDDGSAPPTPGATYTLISFATQAGFTAADFSYTYAGNAANL
ncbi:MAG TPA: hypothetical protein VFS55_04110, partial [Dokdonella sp.]|nr:hypothetical protein [Dokdonella sp.]